MDFPESKQAAMERVGKGDGNLVFVPHGCAVAFMDMNDFVNHT